MSTAETQLQQKRDRFAKLDSDNDASFTALREKLGASFGMDVAGTRVEMLISHLRESGVFPEEAYLDFEIAFHEKVAEALEGFWSDVRNREAVSKLVVPKERPKKLIVPGGQ